MSLTPQRFTGRAGSRSDGRIRRALDGQVDSGRKFDESLAVASDGRLGIQLARNSGLTMTRKGMMIDPVAVGDKNHDPIAAQQNLASGATAAQIVTAFNTLLAELRRTKRMR